MIARLPKRKAPGPNGILTAAIKQLPRRVMVAMTRLFNGVTRTEHFPGSWKMGRVFSIPKASKNLRLASSQRPIILLSHIAKLFEPDTQPSSSWHESCITWLPNTIELTAPLESSSISRAFDRVWYPGFLYKLLNNIQIPSVLVQTVASFLKYRSFFVAVKDATSDPRPVHAEVSQSSCLSPCLYAIYTDDIPTLAVQLQDWEEDVVLAFYADDSAYLSSSRRADVAVAKFQRVLDLLQNWLDKWRVAVNVTKTASLLTGQLRIMSPKLRLRGQKVDWQTRVLYLGIQIDRSMPVAAQAEHIVHQSRAGWSMLRPVL
ncbi:RNA-directed DNA polymerase from mobile element jockey [Eumeta japonica]|uniref:RNA-directed DNA polymerase from mobile element jockey n=1 Tax=Eumeta variegata TaxID=151549 RepID=A0A4C1ZNS1_EUMVA|nr:RNA-directed DNA polymerase from mobile element jockey [Eumeta japonica]